MTNDTGFDLGQLAGLREWQRSNSGDNSGMHAGGSQGSSYQRQQPENSSQYGSKTGSYWEEKGSDREQSAENRMNGQNPDKRH